MPNKHQTSKDLVVDIKYKLMVEKRASCHCGRFPPSFIHQVIMITGLNKLYDYVLALKMALDADRALNLHSNSNSNDGRISREAL